MTKTTALVSILAMLMLFSCQQDREVPKPETLYIFPHDSQVDAKWLACGYQRYESCSDWIKKKTRKAVGTPSRTELIELGEYFHSSFISQSIGNHPRKDWVVEIVERMKPHLKNKNYPYDTYVVDSPHFNAFTIPGGNIYVTTGLLDAVTNIHELSYVIGHEFGHNENNHTRELARLYKYQELNKRKGTLWGDFLTAFMGVSSSICGKADELECDISSIFLLNKAGFDPEEALGGVNLLKKYGKPKPADNWQKMYLTIFKTHPWGEDRVTCVRNYVHLAKVDAVCQEIYSDRKGKVNTKSSPLNIWAYPIKVADKLGKMQKGEPLSIICDCVEQEYRKHRDWLFVESQSGIRGWVDKKYVQVIGH